MDNRERAKTAIRKMKRFNIDRLNTISNRYGISMILAVYLFNATH